MAGRLKRIVDYVKAKSYLKNLAVVQLNMRLLVDTKHAVNVEDFKEATPDDPDLERKLIQAAKEVLKVNRLDIPFN